MKLVTSPAHSHLADSWWHYGASSSEQWKFATVLDTVMSAEDLRAARVPELVAKFETRAARSQDTGTPSVQNMQRTSKDQPAESSSSSSSGESEERSAAEPAVRPQAVSADDGLLKQAALRVEKDLAGVPIPEVTSSAAISSAATDAIGNTPLAAGQLTEGQGASQPEIPAASRLSTALLQAHDAQTSEPQKAVPASLAVQTSDSRRGTGDSVAEPLPASAYRAPPQPSRFATKPTRAAPPSESGESTASSSYAEAEPFSSGAGAKPAAAALGLSVVVNNANRLRTESDVSQDAGETPTSARPLMTGPSSTALAAAPGSVTVSPKGSVVGFMPLPAGSPHPLQADDTQSIDSDGLGGRPLLRSNFQASDDVAYREASFARSQDSMTQPVSYSKLAGQSMTGRGPVQKSRLAPESSAGSFASVARSEASFMSSVGGSRSKEQALADTYARASARLKTLEENEGELFQRKSQWSEGFAAFMEFKSRVVGFFTLWKNNIQTVEGKHGSNVSLTLYFLRFALIINILMTAIWVVFTVFPFLTSPPTSFSWDIFTDTSPSLMLQGYGLDDTFLLYGGYNYTVGTKHGFFRPDLLWPIAMGAMYLFSLLILLYVIQQRLQGEGDNAFVGSNKLFPFSTVVFASWDYHLTDAGAARNLRHSIRNQLKEMVNDAMLEDKIVDTRTRVKGYISKGLMLIVLWPAIVCFTAAGTFFTIRYQQQINQQLGTGFGYTICLSFINIVSSQAVQMTTDWEDWHPSLRTNVEAVKLFVLKTINLATLIYQLFLIQTNANNAQKYLHVSNYADYLTTCDPTLGVVSADAQCSKGLQCCDATCANQTNTLNLEGYCVPGCAEDVIGMTFYRYILTNVVSINGVELVSALGKKCLHMASHVEPPWVVIQVVENQALIWLGSMYAPLLPLIGLAANIIAFYFKLLLAIYLHSPPTTRHSASRTSNLAYGLMLLTAVFTTVPLVYDLQVTRQRCGPHQGTSIKNALVDAINSKHFVASVLSWLINPIVLGSVILFVGFWLLITRGQLKRYYTESSKLKEEFDKYRREMQVKVLVTRKRGSRASSVAPSQGGSFTSGQSFIAAQHSSDTEERVAVDMGGSIAREDRSMTHEGILLHEAPQSPKPTGNFSKPSKVQFSQEPSSPSPRGIRSVSLFAPDGRSGRGAGSSSMSTVPQQQGAIINAQAAQIDDLLDIHSRAYMEAQQARRGTSFVDASGSTYNFKGVPDRK